MSSSRKVVSIGPRPDRGPGTAADRWVAGGNPTRAVKGNGTPAIVRMTFDLDADLHHRLKVGAVQLGRPMTELIRELIEERFPE